jgi:hypothetical protein
MRARCSLCVAPSKIQGTEENHKYGYDLSTTEAPLATVCNCTTNLPLQYKCHLICRSGAFSEKSSAKSIFKFYIKFINEPRMFDI